MSAHLRIAPSPLQRLHTSPTCTYILCTRGCTSKRCASRAPSRSNAELLRTASHSTFDHGTGRGVLSAPSDGDHVWRCPRCYRHTHGGANQPPTPITMRRPLWSPAAARTNSTTALTEAASCGTLWPAEWRTTLVASGAAAAASAAISSHWPTYSSDSSKTCRLGRPHLRERCGGGVIDERRRPTWRR